MFNPEIFEQDTSSSIKVLMENKSDEIEPITVMVNIKNGKYCAATVTYPMTAAAFDATRDFGYPSPNSPVGR